MAAPCRHRLGPDSLGNPHDCHGEPGLYALTATCVACGATGMLPTPLRAPLGWPKSKCPGYRGRGHLPDPRKDRTVAYSRDRRVLRVDTECGGCGIWMALRQPVSPDPDAVAWGLEA